MAKFYFNQHQQIVKRVHTFNEKYSLTTKKTIETKSNPHRQHCKHSRSAKAQHTTKQSPYRADLTNTHIQATRREFDS